MQPRAMRVSSIACVAMTTDRPTVLHAADVRFVRDLRAWIGHVNPHHPLRSARTVHEVVLTGATGGIELVPHWKPEPEVLVTHHLEERPAGSPTLAWRSRTSRAGRPRCRTASGAEMAREPNATGADIPTVPSGPDRTRRNRSGG